MKEETPLRCEVSSETGSSVLPLRYREGAVKMVDDLTRVAEGLGLGLGLGFRV